jgi:hypothetical protein
VEVTDSVKALLKCCDYILGWEGYDVFTELGENEYWQVLGGELWDRPHYVQKPEDNQTELNSLHNQILGAIPS